MGKRRHAPPGFLRRSRIANRDEKGTPIQLSDVTPLILTCNEQDNLRRTLRQLAWAVRVVVVDSESSDRTRQIAEEFPNVDVLIRKFDNHTAQWNYGLQQVTTGWVLSLDADYVCPEGLAKELADLTPDAEGYAARFRYCIFGKPLRASLYPPRVVLFDPRAFEYIHDGHTQLLDTQGKHVKQLRTVIDHDDRKPLGRWVQSQINYARLEADKLLAAAPGSLGWKDRLRQWIVAAPPLTVVYCLFVRGLLLDGRAGLYYTLQRLLAELLLSMYLLDRRLRRVTESEEVTA